MKTSLVKFFCCMIAAVLLGLAATAQNPDDPGGGVDDVPVDGGIILLVAVGAGYGLRQLRKAGTAYSSGGEA